MNTANMVNLGKAGAGHTFIIGKEKYWKFVTPCHRKVWNNMDNLRKILSNFAAEFCKQLKIHKPLRIVILCVISVWLLTLTVLSSMEISSLTNDYRYSLETEGGILVILIALCLFSLFAFIRRKIKSLKKWLIRFVLVLNNKRKRGVSSWHSSLMLWHRVTAYNE
jgi:hypothetical protein